MRVLPLETSFTGHRCVYEWVATALWLFAGGLPVLGVWQIMYTILPAAGLFLICLFWFLLWFYRYFTMKRHIPAEVATLRRTHAESCIVSVLVFAFFIHPTITQQVGAVRARVCVYACSSLPHWSLGIAAPLHPPRRSRSLPADSWMSTLASGGLWLTWTWSAMTRSIGLG